MLLVSCLLVGCDLLPRSAAGAAVDRGFDPALVIDRGAVAYAPRLSGNAIEVVAVDRDGNVAVVGSSGPVRPPPWVAIGGGMASADAEPCCVFIYGTVLQADRVEVDWTERQQGGAISSGIFLVILPADDVDAALLAWALVRDDGTVVASGRGPGGP